MLVFFMAFCTFCCLFFYLFAHLFCPPLYLLSKVFLVCVSCLSACLSVFFLFFFYQSLSYCLLILYIFLSFCFSVPSVFYVWFSDILSIICILLSLFSCLFILFIFRLFLPSLFVINRVSQLVFFQLSVFNVYISCLSFGVCLFVCLFIYLLRLSCCLSSCPFFLFLIQPAVFRCFLCICLFCVSLIRFCLSVSFPVYDSVCFRLCLFRLSFFLYDLI